MNSVCSAVWKSSARSGRLADISWWQWSCVVSCVTVWHLNVATLSPPWCQLVDKAGLFSVLNDEIVSYKIVKPGVVEGGGSVGDNEGWVWSVTISYLDTTGGQKLVRQPVRLKLVLTEIISRSSFKQWSKCSLAQAALLCLISDEYWEKRSLKKGFSSTTEHFPPGLFLSPYDLS